MKRKKILIYMFLFSVIFSFSGCGKEKEKNTKASTEAEITEEPKVTTPTDVEKEPEPKKDEDGFYEADDYVITTDVTVNLRVAPDTNADIYRLLPEGEVLYRNGYNEQWCRVVVDNTNFYVHADYVKETEPPEDATEQDTSSEEEQDDDKKNTAKIIVIDPGNQANANAATEAIGPGSEETKKCATVGSVGSTYGTKEYELNLTYANLLKDELEKRGYEVILTRDNNNVDMSNKTRAEFANTSGASVFIRIQMNYSSNSNLKGVMAVCMPADSHYNSNLYKDSNELSTRILQGIVEETGAANQGIYETEEMTAINWSQIPVTVIELGFLSNEDEEEKLLDDEYKEKMVTGIANGIDYYFE